MTVPSASPHPRGAPPDGAALGERPLARTGHDLGRCYRAALQWLRESLIAPAGASCRAPHPARDTWALVPTLLASGERSLAGTLLDDILSSQDPHGCWSGQEPGRVVGDTTTAVSALAAAWPSTPSVESALRRGCEWLCSMPFLAPGFLLTRALRTCRGTAIERCEGLLAAAALGRAGESLGRPHLVAAAQRVVAWPSPTLRRRAARAANWLGSQVTHSHHDDLGPLLDLAREELVRPTLARAARRQHGDGAVTAEDAPGLVCPRCLGQLTSAWCRTGQRDPAIRALLYLGTVQSASGAFPGPVAPDPATPSSMQLTVKEFLDALHWHVRTAFDSQVDLFEDRTNSCDGRVAFLLKAAGPLHGRRVLDAGCGRGAVARALLEACPTAEVWGVDLSLTMLRHAPQAMHARHGSIQNLPFPDACFDVSICVEALEHAGNAPGAVAELCRVVRPGGRVLIVDKSLDRAGALEIEEWEQWFSCRDVESWLELCCGEVRSEVLEHCPEYGPGLFLGWVGTRA